MLDIEEIEYINKLSSEGHNIKYIVYKTGRDKETVAKYINKGIPEAEFKSNKVVSRAYKYGAPSYNFYALYAAILNPKLSSQQALSYFGIGNAPKETTLVKKVKLKKISAQEIREDYEKGLTILALKLKYNLTNTSVSQAIKEAGGTIRGRGCHASMKNERTSLKFI